MSLSVRVLSCALACALLPPLAAQAAGFSLDSPSFTEGGTLPDRHVFNGFGCSGTNLSPALTWREPPAGTKSFAVTAYDPDAPTGSGWWHWVVFNIPATVSHLDEGIGGKARLPAGAVESRTDFGQPGYGGACPPPGTPHHYIFTVHALKVERLDLPADASAAMVGFMLNANGLGKTSLTATYGR